MTNEAERARTTGQEIERRRAGRLRVVLGRDLPVQYLVAVVIGPKHPMQAPRELKRLALRHASICQGSSPVSTSVALNR